MGDFLINQQKAILSPAGTEVAVAGSGEDGYAAVQM